MTATAAGLPDTLGGYFRRHLRAYVFGGACLFAFQFAMNRIDWTSKAAVDALFSEHPENAFRAAALMLVLGVVAFGVRVASRFFIFNAGRDAEYELRSQLLAKLHTLGAVFYRKRSPGDIMSRATNDLAQVRLVLGFGILNIVNVVFAFASALQVMVQISPRLALASLAHVPVLVVLTRMLGRAMFSRTRESQRVLGELSGVIQGSLAGMRVVRSFALKDAEERRFAAVNQSYLDASLGLARVRGGLGVAMGSVSAAGMLVFFSYGGSLLLRGPEAGGLTKGDFFAFWLALGRMTWPILALGFSVSVVQRGRAGFTRLKEVFDEQPEVVDGALSAPDRSAGALSVRGLSYRYGSTEVLRNVSFEVPSGTSVAIVGRTGSGKSTIALLLARLLPTPRGTVLLDGRDVCDLPLRYVRASIGYAQQDAFLFSTTVARNIAFCLPEYDSEDALRRVREAASRAAVTEEIDVLPEQYDTVVGERGVQLSGGQKQRVALARALMRDASVLVLDDPLSAVDAKTEQRILDGLDGVHGRGGKDARSTLVLVTHRVAAAARCDRILVLDEGRIVDAGTHDELTKRGGLYAEFAREQYMERAMEAALALDEGPSP
jgi:ATP-binding cassette subfamily B protein